MAALASPLLMLLLASCAHPSPRKHDSHGTISLKGLPDDAEITLHPLSLEFLKVAGMYDDVYQSIADGIEMRIDDPEQLRLYIDYLRRLDSFSNILLENISPHIRDGDKLYWYELSTVEGDTGYSEGGVMVVRNGAAVHRYIEHSVTAKSINTNTVEQETGGNR